ncbi:hypothetical protein CY35_05G119200 [Sphagnum magellanicum]|nr:hypothetical protein CY35_05G119200 [Sphagnum magellanicum]
MEFWGIEIPAGKPVTCVPGEGMYLHVSQAALGEGKGKSEGSNKAVLSVEVDATKVVLGTLYQGKCDQISLDLVFDRDFVVSHTGSSVSLYLCGYRTEAPQDEFDSEEGMTDEDEDEDEEEPVQPAVPLIKANGDAQGGKKAVKPETAKSVITPEAAAAAGKAAAAPVLKKLEQQQTKPKGPVPVLAEDDEDEEDDEDDEEDEDDDEDEEPNVGPFVMDMDSDSDDEEFDELDEDEFDEDDEDDEDDENDEEDEEDDEDELELEPAKLGAKRPAAGLPKVVDKKAKTETPNKPASVVKKAKEAATPVAKTPKKEVAKTARKEEITPKEKNAKTPSDKTPKGAVGATPTATPASTKKLGEYKCKDCEKNFVTETALTQHSAAKHKK